MELYGRGGKYPVAAYYGVGGRDPVANLYTPDIRAKRYIPTLSGSQYGTIDTPITFTGDFEVEVEFASTDTALIGIGLFGYSGGGTTNYLQIKNAGGNCGLVTDDGAVIWSHGDVHLDGKVRKLKSAREGNDLVIYLDGVEKQRNTLGAASNVTIDLVGCIGIATVPLQFFNGEILSVKFTDAGTVVADFVFDSGSTTDQPSRGGGNNVTLVNFATTDWNRYTQQRNILHDAGVISEAWVGDNEIINGGFDDGSVWTLGVGWTIGSGVLSGVAGTASVIRQDAGTIENDKYLAKSTLLNYSVGTANQRVGATVGAALTANGTYTEIITAGVTSAQTGTQKNATFAGDIDNVSVQKLLEVA